jgi:hypothetical protein
VTLLPFAQLDFPGAIAIGEGRYVVRAEPGDQPDVLALRILGAPRAASRLRRGRPVALESEPDATPLPLSRVTLVKSAAFDDESAAADWLDRVSGDDELTSGLTAETCRTLNRAIHAHRVSAPDAYAADLHPAAAVAVRFGYGTGEEVAEGRWSAAFELPEAKRRGLRSALIDGAGAQQRIAAVLGGRDAVRPAEALLLDAELAASEARHAEAAIAAAAAAQALAASSGAPSGTAESVASTSALRKAALSGTAISEQELRETLRALRRAVRASLSA